MKIIILFQLVSYLLIFIFQDVIAQVKGSTYNFIVIPAPSLKNHHKIVIH